nr:hypothetical protein [Tanacetum cinerariifolium]
MCVPTIVRHHRCKWCWVSVGSEWGVCEEWCKWREMEKVGFLGDGGKHCAVHSVLKRKDREADYRHIKWIEDLVPRTMWIEEPIGYDKHALWGVSHWGRKRQQFYGFAVNRESARDVYSKRRIVAVTEFKIVEWHSYKHLDWITVRRDDDKLYKFKEGDFKRLRIQDIEDMLLLLVQGKLTNLTVEELFDACGKHHFSVGSATHHINMAQVSSVTSKVQGYTAYPNDVPQFNPAQLPFNKSSGRSSAYYQRMVMRKAISGMLAKVLHNEPFDNEILKVQKVLFDRGRNLGRQEARDLLMSNQQLLTFDPDLPRKAKDVVRGVLERGDSSAGEGRAVDVLFKDLSSKLRDFDVYLCYLIVNFQFMSSDSHATITYTLMSSYEVIVNGYYGMPMDPLDPYVQLVMDAPPSPDYIPRPEAPPSPDYIPGLEYPEYLPPADDVLPAEEQPLPTAVSPTAESPGYITKSDPEMEPEEEDGDDEKSEEESIEYPTSGRD